MSVMLVVIFMCGMSFVFDRLGFFWGCGVFLLLGCLFGYIVFWYTCIVSDLCVFFAC